MNSFVTVKGGEYEFEISKSRFIAFCGRVRTDAEANGILAELRKKYKDCTHICYAYVSGESARSSDDGEPAGTAGAPIAECIRTAGLSETMVSVVRYFGGVKLGAGGLVRAYTKAASEVIARAKRVEAANCELVRAEFDYSVWKKIEKRVVQSLYKITALEYNRTVDVTYAAISASDLEEELCSLTQGKCAFKRLGNCRVERDL